MAAPASRQLLLVDPVPQLPGRYKAFPKNPSSGLTINATEDVSEALGLLRRETFDAVALHLRHTGSLVLTKQFRAAQPEARLLLLVAPEDVDLRQEALKAGAQAIVTAVQDDDAQLRLLETAMEASRLSTI